LFFILQDYKGYFSNLLWDNRFHGFERLPDSGRVNCRELSGKKWLVISLYFGLPIMIYLIKPFYAAAIA
jgi:hypothetical protein